MGEVYKATDTRLDRTVAIKVLPEHVASDPDLKQRFEREARTVAALNHPHICTLHDIGTQDGIDFLVMEYLDWETVGSQAPQDESASAPLASACSCHRGAPRARRTLCLNCRPPMRRMRSILAPVRRCNGHAARPPFGSLGGSESAWHVTHTGTDGDHLSILTVQ